MLFLVPGAVWSLPLPELPYPFALLVAVGAQSCETHTTVVPAQACEGRLRLEPGAWALPPGTHTLGIWGQTSPTNPDPTLADAPWYRALELRVFANACTPISPE